MSARRIGLLLALCFGVNLAWGQNASATPDTNPIGKVLTVTGTVRIDHSAAITVQANLPTNGADGTKVGIVEDQKFHFRKVELGHDYGTEIEVASGLNGKEQVVKNPGLRLIEGGEVRVTGAEGTADTGAGKATRLTQR